MKLRTQLILLFLFLTVLPMTGIVVFSYFSSVQALEEAERRNAEEMTEEISQRMESVRRRLGNDVAGLGEMAWAELIVEGPEMPEEFARAMEDLMSSSGPILGDLEMEPEPSPPPAPPQPQEAPERNEKPPTLGGDTPVVVGAGAGLHFAGLLLEEVLADGVSEAVKALAEEGLADEMKIPAREADRLIGRLQPQVSARKLLRQVLRSSQRGQGEIAFAIDSTGTLFAGDEADIPTLEGLRLTSPEGEKAAEDAKAQQGWVVVRKHDSNSDLTFGIARPVGDALDSLRDNAARNLGSGLVLIGLALLGILPLSSRLTRSIVDLTSGAERFADGDLEARVPVRSANELGRLARTFNRMAHELKENQRRLVEEERLRKEQELQQRLLAAENQRKTQELEEARRFQLSLLPAAPPVVPHLTLAVEMRTATEVGGDYYDFDLRPDGTLTAAVGDATGHGARAGTMVTAIKSLFMADRGGSEPVDFLREASASVKRIGLGHGDQGRMAMALALARFEGRRMTLANAGMPPVLVHRAAADQVEELLVPGMPLGGVAGFPYRSRQVDLQEGDTVLFLSDGLPELADAPGELLGYERLRQTFARLARHEPDALVQELLAEADRWTGGEPPTDDITLLLVRVH